MYPAGQAQNGSAPPRTAAERRARRRTANWRVEDEDALGPARGILIAALAGLLLWGVIFLFVWLAFLR